MSLWIRIHGLDEGRKHFVVEVRNGGKDPVLEAEVEIDTLPESDSDAVVIALPHMPLNIRSPHPLVVYLCFEGRPPVEAGRLKITPRWDVTKN
jgi:hypothetical protein